MMTKKSKIGVMPRRSKTTMSLALLSSPMRAHWMACSRVSWARVDGSATVACWLKGPPVGCLASSERRQSESDNERQASQSRSSRLLPLALRERGRGEGKPPCLSSFCILPHVQAEGGNEISRIPNSAGSSTPDGLYPYPHISQASRNQPSLEFVKFRCPPRP